MSINVTVPLEALENPDVARALSQLMLSLGGLEPRVARVARPARVVKESPPSPSQPRAPKRERKPRAAAPRAEAKAKPRARSPEQRYRDFVDNLPEPSREFIELIEKHGNLRLSQAVRELGITRPKTLGGITGSLTRWARKRDVELPYKAGKTSDGERVWTWTRASEAGAPTAKRTRSRRRAGSRGAASARSSKRKEAEPAPPREPKPKPDVTGPAILDDERYAQLVDGMTDTARRFLVALSENGQLSMTQALEAIERRRAKYVGDAVRAYVFRARERGLTLPFEERPGDGERMWVWMGLRQATDEPAEKPAEAKKPEPTGVIVIRGGRDKARDSG